MNEAGLYHQWHRVKEQVNSGSGALELSNRMIRLDELAYSCMPDVYYCLVFKPKQALLAV